MKVGDLVVYSTTEKEYSDTEFSCPINKFAFLIGIDLHKATIMIREGNRYKMETVLKCNLSYIHELNMLRKATEKVYDIEIKRLESMMKSTKRSDYEHELVEKSKEIESTIKNLAKNLVEEDDKINFENKIKELSQLKKQYFGIECDEVTVARKQNGKLKSLIRELEVDKKRANREISDDVFEKMTKECYKYRRDNC